MNLESKKAVLESAIASIADEEIINELKEFLNIECNKIQPINYYLKNYCNKIVKDKPIANENKNSIKSGLTIFDNLTGGFKTGTLNVVVARKGMGLRAFLISILNNIAITNKQSVVVFSLNNTAKIFTNYIIASETGVVFKKLNENALEKHEIEHLNLNIKPLINAPIFIDDSNPLTVIGIKHRVMQLLKGEQISIVMIDNLEKIIGKRELVIKELNELAIELQIPIITMYELQLNLAAKMKFNYKPTYGDFIRKYTSIGFHNFIETLIFIYRPEFYNLTEWDDKTSCENQAELICYGKDFENKNVRVKFIGNVQRFVDL